MGRKIQQLGNSQKMSKQAHAILRSIYRTNAITPKGILKYRVKNKRVNPQCYASKKESKAREKSIQSKTEKKSLSRRRTAKYSSMKDVYQSFRNLKLKKRKLCPKKKRVKFLVENEEGN